MLVHTLSDLRERIADPYIQKVNVLGLHHTVSSWIKTQPDPKNPVGTVINVSSGLEGLVSPGLSAYSTSKLAGHRYMEYLAAGE